VQGNVGTHVNLSRDTPVNFVFEGNVLWGAGTAGNIPAAGFARMDTQLAADSGLMRVRAGSALLDAAVGSDPDVSTDMDGQPRSGVKDVGADELSTAPVVIRPLIAADVGPNAP
jgi:hypothetical protein